MFKIKNLIQIALALVVVLMACMVFKILLVKPRGTMYKNLPDNGVSGFIKRNAPEKERER